MRERERERERERKEREKDLCPVPVKVCFSVASLSIVSSIKLAKLRSPMVPAVTKLALS